MPRRALMVSVVLMCACSGSKSDPANDRLSPGDMLITVDDRLDTVSVESPNGPGKYGIAGYYVVPTGTSLQCQSDEADDGKAPRNIRVTIMGGEYRGKSGDIRRDRVRLVPR